MLLKKKIVIAEDDDSIVDLMTTTLDDSVYACVRAADGEEAMGLLRVHPPDLLVLDVMMPRMDGVEVARRVKEDPVLFETPILMLTALSAVDNRIDGLNAGADAYLSKPFDVREFRAQVNALIRSSQRERENRRHPITNLPGASALEERITQVLGQSGEAGQWAVVHFTVPEFELYARRLGYNRVDLLVASLAELLQNKFLSHMQLHALLSHLGGADFVAVIAQDSVEALVKDAIEGFEAGYSAWLVKNSPMNTLTLTAAVASTTGLKPGELKPLADRLAATLKLAKAEKKSTYVVWTA